MLLAVYQDYNALLLARPHVLSCAQLVAHSNPYAYVLLTQLTVTAVLLATSFCQPCC